MAQPCGSLPVRAEVGDVVGRAVQAVRAGADEQVRILTLWSLRRFDARVPDVALEKAGRAAGNANVACARDRIAKQFEAVYNEPSGLAVDRVNQLAVCALLQDQLDELKAALCEEDQFNYIDLTQ